MVTPAAERQAVAHLMEHHEMSERRACKAIGCCRMTVRYKTKRPDDRALRERLTGLARERLRFGYRRLHVLLKREGLKVNHKKLFRLYREEKLSVRRRAVMTASNIAHNTRWAAIQVSGPETWQAVADQISRYLSESQAAGLLAGDTPRRAFYVKCDQDTNGRGHGLSFVVGLALARPDEFVAFRFEHDVSDCRVTEISWQPGAGLAN